MYPRILALGFAALCISAQAADLIPIEEFARPTAYNRAGLASDGKTGAFLRDVDGLSQLFFIDVATAKVNGYSLGEGGLVHGYREVIGYRWLGAKRVLVEIGVGGWLLEGAAVYDRDGKNWQPVSGLVGYGSGVGRSANITNAYDVIYSFKDDARVLMLEHNTYALDAKVRTPDVVDVDRTARTYEPAVKNPGNVTSWLPDRQGVIRIGLERKDEKANLIYRDDAKSPWRSLTKTMLDLEDLPMPIGFSSDGKGGYIAALNEKKCRAVYLFDLTTEQMGKPLLEVPGCDAWSSSSGALLGSGAMGGAIWSDRKQAIVGFWYITDGLRVKWFDSDYERSMAMIDQALPGRINLPVSIANDDQTMLIYSFSDCQPGIYYLCTPANNELKEFVRTRPWIKPEQMASMHPIKYTARDGLEIKGYLTVPRGQKPSNLPLVVMPHDGSPEPRDVWGFNPLVQMLANRGYAILQMDYRGSSGYGRDFSKKETVRSAGKSRRILRMRRAGL